MTQETGPQGTAEEQIDETGDAELEGLDDIDDIEFSLDEIENKIAPLALA